MNYPCGPMPSRGGGCQFWKVASALAWVLAMLLGATNRAMCQDSFKLATFNLYRPGLNSSPPALREQTLTRYGKEFLSQADIAFVQEDGNNTWTKALADAAGFPIITGVVTTDFNGPDIAILSRQPLANIVLHTMQQKGFWLEAKTTINGRELLLVTSHYPVGVSASDNTARDAISMDILDRVSAYGGDAFVGGDFNATDGDVPITRLAFAMWDSLKVAPSSRFCDTYSTTDLPVPPNPQRIDYLFFRGHYAVSQFDACQMTAPSDHKMVLATYHFDPAAAVAPFHPPPPPPPPPCAMNCQARQQACMLAAHNGPARSACGQAAKECKATCSGH